MIERTFLATVTLPDDWMEPGETEGDEWAAVKDAIDQRLERARPYWLPEATLAIIEWASEPEEVKPVRHVHDTADLHEQDAFEDTQSLTAPESGPEVTR